MGLGMTNPTNPENHCQQGSPKLLSAELSDASRGQQETSSRGWPRRRRPRPTRSNGARCATRRGKVAGARRGSERAKRKCIASPAAHSARK
eukprot:9911428-Alexandrium_andersonii.AAC.1